MTMAGTLAFAQSEPLTVAEKSDFKSTSTSAEVVEFVDFCADKADHVKKFVYGKTVEGREMVGVTISNRPFALGQKDDRARVLIIGNIHSGECAGKEAILMMLRELTYAPQHPWLESAVIVLVPNYSADSNDRMGLNNRRGQIGPENGMGRRENAQGLDLNRDFVKLDSPEGRSMVGLIDSLDPHVFVDCHTTNGSKHQYVLTYDIPHNPACPALIRDYMRGKMMPVISQEMEKKGAFTFYYGNFNKDHTKWTTYGHEPRYSTEYVGLRGRLAVLSEAYSYISYKDRIEATKDFCTEILNYVTDNKKTICEIVAEVDRQLVEIAKTSPERISLSLGAAVSAFDKKFSLKGYKDEKPFDYECDFVGNYQSTKQTPLPFAYMIPRQHVRVVDRLLMHGIEVERVQTEKVITGMEVDTIKSVDRNERAFQRHKMIRVEANRNVLDATIEQGSFVVKTAQPLGMLAGYLLESESDDGFAFWNFFDEDLRVGEPYPVTRLQKSVELDSKPVSEIEKNVPLSLNLIDGDNELLGDHPKTPVWQGKTNQIEAKSWGRTFLIDAESQSFVGAVQTPFSKGELVKVLLEGGVAKDAATGLADADPKISDDQKTTILSNEGYTAIVHGEKNESGNTNAKIELIGTPERKADLIHFNHDETIVAYSTDQALNFFDLAMWENTAIKSDSKDIFVGRLDWVYQEELYGRGNFKGYWLNPAHDSVAYLELDESPVLPFTVMDHVPVRGGSEFTNYPKAGDPNPTVKLAVANTRTGNPRYVDLKQYDGIEILISRVSWSADGSQLLVQVQNREQTWLDLVSTDKDGNSPRVLFRDKTPAWIEAPGDPPFLADGSFIWPSPRSGYSHLYHYSSDGSLIGALTDGEWEVRDLIGIDPAQEYVYFTATKETPLENHAYRIRLADKSLERLTQDPGSHAVSFSHDFSYFIDSFSTISSPPLARLFRNDGTFLRVLNAPTDDRLKYINLVDPEFLTVDSGNEQPMDARIIRPANFDKNKKYPVLVHIYAGPQAPKVRNAWMGDWYLWHQFLAQKGYVIWICDNQSASYRSKKHAWPIHRNMAEGELKDIEKGVAWLKKQPWVDSDRIGIWGWSYGGYMTAYAMTHSNTFRAGISGAPVTDWKNYDSIYTERYMDTPQNNPEGYTRSSVLSAAGDLHGKMLLIHGSTDDNVHLNNSMQLIQELQKSGKQFELMIYPQNRHSVKDKKQLAHMRKLMTDFILKNL